MPVAVGFGIKNGETAAAVANVSDGVIVGSALVNIVAANQNASIEQSVRKFLNFLLLYVKKWMRNESSCH